MKITYNDMFNDISDVAFDVLEENHIFNDETDDMFSSDKTSKDVTGMIHDQKIIRKRRFAVRSVLLAAALAAMTSMLAIAHNYGAALIDDSNRHLVGKESYLSYTITKADEELPPAEAPSDEVWETAPLIKSHKNVVITPNTITEFAVTGDSGRYTTPEIIFGNNDLVIFEKEDGSGWKLDKGETLVFQVTEYESEINWGRGQIISFYYICNRDILKGKTEPRKALDQTFEITAEKDGEYYICLLGASSDPASLLNNLSKNNKESTVTGAGDCTLNLFLSFQFQSLQYILNYPCILNKVDSKTFFACIFQGCPHMISCFFVKN